MTVQKAQIEGRINLVRVRVDALQPDPDNPRRHPPRNVEVTQNSMKRFGNVELLVVQKSRNRVIGGNSRLEILKAAGVEMVDVNLVDCTDSEARQLSVALNRPGELAEWNTDVLDRLLGELRAQEVDMAPLGFTQTDLYELGVATPDFQPVPEDLQKRLDEKAKVTCPGCGIQFTP